MYRVLSPDGFDIDCEAVYRSEKEALKARARFAERYQAQGYYSTGNRERIPVSLIADYCRIIPA